MNAFSRILTIVTLALAAAVGGLAGWATAAPGPHPAAWSSNDGGASATPDAGVIAARPAVERGVKVLSERLRSGPMDARQREILFGATQYARR